MTSQEKQLAQKIMRMKRDQINSANEAVQAAERALAHAKSAAETKQKEWANAEVIYNGVTDGSIEFCELFDI